MTPQSATPGNPQLGLDFNAPAKARRHGADTSKAAAARATPRCAVLRQRILEHLQAIVANGAPGATGDEISASLAVDLYEVRRRVSDLHGMELIADSGHRRTTASGSPAIVWRPV